MVVRRPRKVASLNAGISRGVSSGSGFVVDGAGHVITAGHVAVGPGFRVSARAADGRIHEGSVRAVLPDNDIGLVRLREAVGRPVVPAASPCLKPGQAVFSLGRPRGGGDTARIGSVKSMRFRRAVHYGRFGYPDAMILKMATRRGESGGPVFNENGELVGMVVSTLSANGRPLNLAHAIPLPPIARFYCSQTACGPRWRRLAATSIRSCP
ncbi:MAG TPA: serine protease [Bryobacterales bacterium]|nr:serine protease [Bryobacterales bacterium]